MRPPEPYRARIAPQSGQPGPAVSEAAAGTRLGEAIAGGARAIHREGIENYQLGRKVEANRQWGEFGVGFNDLIEDVSATTRDARQEFTPGHAERIGQTIEDRSKALLDGLDDPEVRQRAKAMVDNWSTKFRVGEADWEVLRAGEIAVERYSEQRDTAANRTRRMPAVEDYADERDRQLGMIAGMDVSDKVRSALAEETEQLLAISFLQGQNEADPETAKALLGSGAFDDVLDPPQVTALLNGADVEIRRMEAAAARALAQEQAEFRQRLRTFRQEVGDGLDRTGQIPALVEQAQKYGWDDVVVELEGVAADGEFSRVYTGATPIELEQRMAALRTKDELSDLEARELKWIENHLPGVAGRYDSDPVGFYAQEGGKDAPPPLNFADADSVVARSRWADAATERSGKPVPMFSKAELQQFSAIYEDGREGEERVMALLDLLPPRRAMETARLIDPGDLTLPIVATLGPKNRAQARRGREALRADRKMLSDPLRDDLDLEEEIGAMNGEFNRAMAGVPPDQRRAIHETAKQIAAGQMDKWNSTLTPELWDQSLKVAVGMVKEGGVEKGGFGQWGDRWFLLPSGVSNAAFASAVKRSVGDTDNPPVNPDGTPARLSRAVPVAVGGGWYEFRTESGAVVQARKGGTFRVRVTPR